MPAGEALTKRGAEVGRAYAEGLTHKQIAERLGIAPATIRTHLNSIYRKLGVGTKIELLGRLDMAAEVPRPRPRPGGPSSWRSRS
jgi:DNA-binding NarL/FixJ family response regulator